MVALLLGGQIMLLALWKQLFAVTLVVFALALQGKKVLRVLVDGIRRAVKRLAGAFGGLKYECHKRIHNGLMHGNRALSPIVTSIGVPE